MAWGHAGRNRRPRGNRKHLIQPKPASSPRETPPESNFRGCFDLAVDERGNVGGESQVRHQNLREEATRAAMTARFKPFVRDGQPVAARRSSYLVALRTIRSPDRSFPENPDPSVLIALREPAAGTCPSYRVEVRRWRSRYSARDVLMKAHGRTSIRQPSAACLTSSGRQLLRARWLLHLSGFGFPTYITRQNPSATSLCSITGAAFLSRDASKPGGQISEDAARGFGDRARHRQDLRHRRLRERRRDHDAAAP